jgi:hypothetical protein
MSKPSYMRTSKKILLAIAGFLIVLLIVFLMILRNSIQSIHSKAELKYKYKTVTVGNFEKLDFSSHWIVRIRQGKECKVELAVKGDSLMKPGLENSNGTLYFTVDSIFVKENTDSLRVRITMPSLKAIKAVRGTEIHLANFNSDSLHVILENGCIFIGDNNNIRYVSLKTSGDNRLQFIKTY